MLGMRGQKTVEATKESLFRSAICQPAEPSSRDTTARAFVSPSLGEQGPPIRFGFGYMTFDQLS
jgi:hypothetical protein